MATMTGLRFRHGAVAGTDPITRQKDLLARFRMATQEERQWIRDVMREHLIANFPELDPP